MNDTPGGKQAFETRIDSYSEPLTKPFAMKQETDCVRSDRAKEVFEKGIIETKEILLSERPTRRIAILGGCSFHDPHGADELTDRLVEFKREVENDWVIVERINMLKPRTKETTKDDWAGYMRDPRLDGSIDIEFGRRQGRKFYLNVLEKGLPIATEYLDTLTPQFIDDLISYAWIGARSACDPMLRPMMSGVTAVAGIKNTLSGDHTQTINNIQTVFTPSHYPGVNHSVEECKVNTLGNETAHPILRGWEAKPNFYAEDLKEIGAMQSARGLPVAVIVDTAHGHCLTSKKKKSPNVQYDRVAEVLTLMKQASDDPYSHHMMARGIMSEINLLEGNMSLQEYRENPIKGMSITDPCMAFDKFREVFLKTWYG
ncbi:3-deoxy-7-phosphoheptulonate synthase [Candidatus Woesearchaeota archaeon]|nr:3-deoxy-7-phosphoheptulonate synthase [Candidatus Woesearchaeota archaeon]